MTVVSDVRSGSPLGQGPFGDRIVSVSRKRAVFRLLLPGNSDGSADARKINSATDGFRLSLRFDGQAAVDDGRSRSNASPTYRRLFSDERDGDPDESRFFAQLYSVRQVPVHVGIRPEPTVVREPRTLEHISMYRLPPDDVAFRPATLASFPTSAVRTLLTADTRAMSVT